MKDFNQWLHSNNLLPEMTTDVNPNSNQFRQHAANMLGQVADATPFVGTARAGYGALKSAYGMWKNRSGAGDAIKNTAANLANLLFAKDGSGDPRWDLPDEITDTLTPEGKDQLVNFVSSAAKAQQNVQPGFAASIVQQKYNKIFADFISSLQAQ